MKKKECPWILLHTFNRRKFLHERDKGDRQCEGSDKYKDMRTQGKRKVKRKINNKNNPKEEKAHEKAPMEFQVYIHFNTTWCWPRKSSVFVAFCKTEVYKRMECPVYFKKHHINAYNVSYAAVDVIVQSFLCTVEWMLTLSLSIESQCIVHVYTCINVFEKTPKSSSYVGHFYLRRRTHKSKLRIRFVRFIFDHLMASFWCTGLVGFFFLGIHRHSIVFNWPWKLVCSLSTDFQHAGQISLSLPNQPNEKRFRNSFSDTKFN